MGFVRGAVAAGTSTALLQLGPLALGPLGVALVAVLLALLLTGGCCILWRTRVRTSRSVADIMSDTDVSAHSLPPSSPVRLSLGLSQ